MIPLHPATDGYLCSPLSVVSSGYLCLTSTDQTPPPPTGGGGYGGGGWTSRRRRREEWSFSSTKSLEDYRRFIERLKRRHGDLLPEIAEELADENVGEILRTSRLILDGEVVGYQRLLEEDEDLIMIILAAIRGGIVQ